MGNRRRLPLELLVFVVGSAGGTVYTDDKAPVEWLVDKSLIDYAR
jgi:hypothetical protein